MLRRIGENREFRFNSMELGISMLEKVKINFKIGAHLSDSPGYIIVEKKGVTLGVQSIIDLI